MPRHFQVSMVLVFALSFFVPAVSAHVGTERLAPQQELIDALVIGDPFDKKDDLDREFVEGFFDRMGPLYRSGGQRCQEITDAVRSDIVRKREGKEPITGYLLTDWLSLAAGLAYFRTNRDAFKKAHARYGIPPEIILGMLRMETWFGECFGAYNAFPALYHTFVTDAKSRAWVVSEMSALIRLCRTYGCDPNNLPSSSRGALGKSQFLPSTIEAADPRTGEPLFLEDGDGDGVIDLFFDADAILSTARYLVHHGFDADAPRGSECPPSRSDAVRHALFAYNHTCVGYVEPVLRFADAIKPLLDHDRRRGEEDDGQIKH